MNKIKITGRFAVVGPDSAVLAIKRRQHVRVIGGGINCVFVSGAKVTVYGSVVLIDRDVLHVKARKILGKKPPEDSLKRRPRWVKGKPYKWDQ